MSSARQKSRRIGLFVEGDTERGDARQKTLPVFFHKWLDPQTAIDKCPFLKILANDLLTVAKILQ